MKLDAFESLVYFSAAYSQPANLTPPLSYPSPSQYFDVMFHGGDSISATVVADVSTPPSLAFRSGASQVSSFFFSTFLFTSAGDYCVLYDPSGSGWALYADLTGTDLPPTGAVWLSIPPAQKGSVNVSACVTAADMATAFDAAFTALAGIPFALDDSAATGLLVCTASTRAAEPEVDVFNRDDSGPGSIVPNLIAEGQYPQIDLDTDVMSFTDGILYPGLAVTLTSTGTLPAPLLTATSYWAIVVSGSSFQLASSLPNALNGIPVDLTDYGSEGAINTVTPIALSGASIKFQESNDGMDWFDIPAIDGSVTSSNIGSSGAFFINKDRPTSHFVRLYVSLTAGYIDLSAAVLVKGDKQ